jgi:hypothetical protein
MHPIVHPTLRTRQCSCRLGTRTLPVEHLDESLGVPAQPEGVQLDPDEPRLPKRTVGLHKIPLDGPLDSPASGGTPGVLRTY